MISIDLSGKTAVITGSARGIGRAIAEKLAEAGANIIISDIMAEVGEVTAKEIADKRGVKIIRELNLDQSEMPMDKDVINAVLRASEIEGQQPIQLVSMAGHDAANMERLTKTAMLFVQSVEGYSHCPEEYTAPREIEIAAQVYLDTLLILDRELK